MRKRSEVVGQRSSAEERMGNLFSESAVDANARSGGKKIVRAQNGMRTGTYCAECRAPQVMTEGGVSCLGSGHGGADSIDVSGMRVHVERDETPVHPVHAEQYGHEVTATSSKAPQGGVANPAGQPGAPGDAGSNPAVAVFSSPETVTVSRGEWLVQPIQFNSFRVGEVSVTTAVREGEGLEGAAARAHAFCRAEQLRQAEVAMGDYLDFLARVGAEVERRTR